MGLSNVLLRPKLSNEAICVDSLSVLWRACVETLSVILPQLREFFAFSPLNLPLSLSHEHTGVAQTPQGSNSDPQVEHPVTEDQTWFGERLYPVRELFLFDRHIIIAFERSQRRRRRLGDIC